MRTISKSARKFVAMAMAASLLALGVMASQAAAQDSPSIQIEPAAVAGPGSHKFTITGANWNPGLALFIVPCSVPGEQLTTDTPMQEILAAATALTIDDCVQSPLGTASVGEDGTFSVEVTADITANFAFGAGDIIQTQTSGFPVLFIADDMSEDMDDMDMSEDMDDMSEDMDDMDMSEDMDDMSEDMDDMDMSEDMDDMSEDMDDMGDDMVPAGGAETGFGGTAGSDGNSLAAPLAAVVIALALMGAATLLARRNAA